MGVIRTILIILAIYWALKLIARFVLPIVMRSFMGKVEQRMQDRMTDFQQNQPQNNRPEGDIKVEGNNSTNNKKDGDDGDYVDYEEIK